MLPNVTRTRRICVLVGIAVLKSVVGNLMILITGLVVLLVSHGCLLIFSYNSVIWTVIDVR